MQCQCYDMVLTSGYGGTGALSLAVTPQSKKALGLSRRTGIIADPFICCNTHY